MTWPLLLSPFLPLNPPLLPRLSILSPVVWLLNRVEDPTTGVNPALASCERTERSLFASSLDFSWAEVGKLVIRVDKAKIATIPTRTFIIIIACVRELIANLM